MQRQAMAGAGHAPSSEPSSLWLPRGRPQSSAEGAMSAAAQSRARRGRLERRCSSSTGASLPLPPGAIYRTSQGVVPADFEKTHILTVLMGMPVGQLQQLRTIICTPCISEASRTAGMQVKRGICGSSTVKHGAGLQGCTCAPSL